MATYSFVEVFPDGTRKRTTMEIANEQRLKNIIKARGNIAVDIKESGLLNKDIDLRKVTQKDLAVFCEQMSGLIKAGVSIVSCLEMVIKTTTRKKLKNALKDVVISVKSGISFSTALLDYPEVFPLIMTQMIKAGEESGSLDEIFLRLSKQFEKSAKLANTIKKALAYPKMVIAVVIAALVVVCVVVVPQFVEVFEELQTELPFTTKMFIVLSKAFTTYWWLLALFIGFCFIFWIVFSRSDYGKHKLAEWSLKIPLVKDLVEKNVSANFARTLSTLLSSGMDYPKSLEIVADTMSNVLFKEACERIKADVENGDTLTLSLKRQEIFPELLENLLQIGEDTGSIEHMLLNSAEYFEDEVETATVQLTEAINPILIVFVGIMIGLLVYSIYSPMFSVYDAIGAQ